MRFHFGLSFKPKFNKIKWLLFGLLGLGALFFGNILSVDAYANTIGFYPDLVYGYDSTNQQVNETLRLTNDTFYFDTAGTDYNRGYWSSYYSTYFQENNCRYINLTTWFKAYNPNMQLLNRGLSISAKYHGTTNGISGRVIDNSNGYIANEWYNIDTSKRFDFGVYTGTATGYIEGPLILTYECVVTDTQQIIANDNSNTQQIINNDTQNTQNIINNNNQNTQDLIESNKVCFVYGKNKAVLQDKAINNSGLIVDAEGYSVSDFINIYNATITFDRALGSANNTNYCFYDFNRTQISCSQSQIPPIIPNGAYYFRYTSNSTNNPSFKICTNGNQGLTDSINDLNNSLTEEYNGSAGGHEFDLPDYNYPSTIQGFFNLPIDLLRTIVNNSDTCTPYQIDLSSITQRWGGFDYVLTLPCLRTKLQSLLGVIYTVIDSMIAFYLFYNMAMYVLQLIDAITSGTDLFSYLYHGSNNNSGDTGYGHYNRTTGEVVD